MYPYMIYLECSIGQNLPPQVVPIDENSGLGSWPKSSLLLTNAFANVSTTINPENPACLP